MIGAFFDVVGTIYKGAFWRDISRRHRDQKRNRSWVWAYLIWHMAGWPLNLAGVLNDKRWYAAWARDIPWLFRGFTVQEGQELFDWLTTERLIPNLRTDIMDILRDHQAKGRVVALVSGSPQELLDTIVSRLDIEHAVGTPLGVKDGRYTGKIAGTLAMGEGKVVALRDFVADKGFDIDWENSFFFVREAAQVPSVRQDIWDLLKLRRFTMHDAITDVPGIKVGHYTDLKAATGCTVVLCEEGAVGGVEVRGAAPGTRETDLLRPLHLVERAHAVLLAGGSAFGLDAAAGVMRYLEESGHGFDAGVAKVPIVPAAILFDLAIGDAYTRPDPEAGYQACLAASDGPVAEGNVGAGTGATVGKLLGPRYAMKGGLGTASQKIGKGIIVGAIVAVSAMGDVLDPRTGKILAGARNPVGGGFLNSAEAIKGRLAQTMLAFTSTTIGVVATNARLSKEEVNKLAQLACNGYAYAIRPTTMFDGDTLFALSLGDKKGDLSAIGAASAEVMGQAIVRAIKKADSLHGIPAHRDVSGTRA